MLLGTIVAVAYEFAAKLIAPIACTSSQALAKPRMRETKVPDARTALARPMLATGAAVVVARLCGIVGRRRSVVVATSRVVVGDGLLARLPGGLQSPLLAPTQDVAHDAEAEQQHEQGAEDQRADALPVGVHVHCDRAGVSDGDAGRAVE